MQKLVDWFAEVGRDRAIAAAQYRELQRQMPLLYMLLVVNSVAITITYLHHAPAWLTIGFPVPLIGGALLRLVYWYRTRGELLAADQIPERLRATILLAGFFGTAYMVWAMMLTPYGNVHEQAHMALFISATTVGCIFCLAHLPQAAVAVAIAIVPFSIFSVLTSSNIWFPPIAINVITVELVLMRVVFANFASFRELVASRAELMCKNAESERLSRENAAIALSDSLTDLPNRRHFSAALDAMLPACAAENRPVAVGLLDLDCFKPVNDLHGHAVGDALLRAVALRVREAVDPAVTLARLGGDEFGLLLQGASDTCAATACAIAECLRQPFMIGEHAFVVSASLGFATYPDMAANADELLSRADRALYHTKQAGRGGHTIFWQALEAEAIEREHLEQALASADLERELQVVFQPITDLDSGEIVAAEVLARWESPTAGFVSPAVFVPMAERIGRIEDLTRSIITRSVELAAGLPETVAITLNMSACDLHSPAMVDFLIDRVDRSGIGARRVWVEITETAVMRNIDVAAEALARLKAQGIRIALDDFGTGYSSLSYLSRLPIDKIKIDRSFIAGLDEETNRSIIDAILVLGESLSIECLAEGIETEEQLAYIRATSCRYAQGYLISRPVSFPAFRDGLASGMFHRVGPRDRCPLFPETRDGKIVIVRNWHSTVRGEISARMTAER